MDIEVKRQLISDKIKSNDFNFSKEDVFIIKKTPFLLQTISDLLSDDISLWEKFKSKDINDLIDAMQDNNILTSNLIYNFCINSIDDGCIDLKDCYNFLDDEQLKLVNEYIVNKLKDKNYKVSFNHVNINTIPLLLDLDRRDLINGECFVDLNDISLFDKMMEAYSKKPFVFPMMYLDEKLAEEIINKYGYSNFPLSAMTEMYDYYLGQDKNDIIISKLENPNEKFNFFGKDIFDKILSGLTQEKENKFFELLLNKNIFAPFLFCHCNKVYDNETIVKIANCIEKGKIDEDMFFSSYAINKNLINNHRIVEALIEKGYINIAQKSSLFDNYIDEIIRNIDENNPNYQNLNINFNCAEEKYLPLIKTLIKHRNFSFLRHTHKSEECIKDIIYDLYLNKAESDELSVFPNDIELFKELLRNKKYDMASNFFIFEEYIDDKEFMDLLLEACKNDLNFADQLFITSGDFDFIKKKLCRNEKILNFYLTNEFFTESIIDYINHHEDLHSLYNENTYNKTKDYFCKKYNSKIENMDKLESRFGPKIIMYIENENVQKLLSFNEEKIDKFINLFEKENFFMSDAEAIYDGLKQYAFGKQNVSVINIFSNINHSLEDNNDNYLMSLEELATVMDEKFYRKFLKVYSNFEFDNINNNYLLKSIINKIKNGSVEEQVNSREMLHFITDYYIATKREEFRNTYDLFNELHLPFEYDKKDADKAILLLELEEKFDNEDGIKKKLMERLDSNTFDENLINDCRNYLLNIQQFNNDVTFIQSNIGLFIKNAKELVDEKYDYHARQNAARYYESKGEKINRSYYIKSNPLDIYSLISGIRMDIIDETILSDDFHECYDSLKKTMDKYKIHLLPVGFNKFINSEDIGIEWMSSNIAGFISFYSQIYEIEKDRLNSLNRADNNFILNIPSVFMNADIYSRSSSVYEQFLGKEDAILIKSNPKANSATKKLANDQRLKESVSYTIDNFKRMKVTIPTFNEEVFLSNNEKKMRVVVGNFTNSCNVTHGERTGSCMRIGGAGESLFDFCLKNENGFHIRFENPETNEYISRVSGFRNGNTVFLNELRYSCSKYYSTEDVVEACKTVAKELIDKSKDSTCPIENVVISKQYAMKDMDDKLKDLHVSSIKKGLPVFYSDVSNSAVILATSKENNELVPIDFDKEKVPSYLPSRDLIRECYDNSLIGDINRVHSIKKVLDGEEYEYVEPVIFDDEIKYIVCNNDWYIYVDVNDKIYGEYIDIDYRAIEEYNEVYQNVISNFNIKDINVNGEKNVK